MKECILSRPVRRSPQGGGGRDQMKVAWHEVPEPSHRAVLQVVGKRVDISLEGGWNGRTPRTQIVAIGARDTMDGEALREPFDHCLAPGFLELEPRSRR